MRFGRSTMIDPLAARSPMETAAERAAWESLEHGLSLADDSVACALANAQSVYIAHGGEGEWTWYDRGLIEVGKLCQVRMHELWPMRHKLQELNLYVNEWLFQLLDESTRRTGQTCEGDTCPLCRGLYSADAQTFTLCGGRRSTRRSRRTSTRSCREICSSSTRPRR